MLCRAVSEGMAAERPTIHKAPLVKRPAALLGAHMASDGIPRMGIGVIVQVACGLRPSELLRLMPEHIMFHVTLHGPTATLRLGALVSTKANREETTYLRMSEDPEAFELLSRVCALTPYGSLLFPYAYAFYNRKIRELDRRTGMNVGYSGHSARAGFASESR